MKCREFIVNSAILGGAVALDSANLFADENQNKGAMMTWQKSQI